MIKNNEYERNVKKAGKLKPISYDKGFGGFNLKVIVLLRFHIKPKPKIFI